MALIIFVAAAGFVTAFSIWLAWWLHEDYQFSDYTEALNDGCNRVVAGYFQKENEVEA